MCGIAGILPLSGTLDAGCEEEIVRMTRALTHRGPDDEGIHFDGRIALGHRRLSILDTSPSGRQPMETPDGRRRIVFNGECYNFGDLRPRHADYPFRSGSDTEVVLAHLAARGEAGIADLAGMFAFAYWDDETGTLLVVRDRLGEKPLYHATVGNRLYFASEVRALIASGAVEAKLDPRSLEAYLAFGALPDPLSIFEGIVGLSPGHLLRVEKGQISTRPYWDIPAGGDPVTDPVECAEEIRRLLVTSVRGRAISDVPLGAFLSGGVDSGAVTALLAADASLPVETFSIAFRVGDDIVGELDGARALAEHVGAHHREKILTSADIADGLESYVDGLDQPHSDSINTFFVSRFAREHITVALSGLGGDELFAGYRQFRDLARKERWGKYWDRVPGVVPAMAAETAKLLGGDRLERFARYQHGFLGRYAVLRSLFDEVARRDILQEEHLTGFSTPGFLEEHLDRFPRDASLLWQVSYLEMKTYMQHMLLLGTDNSSMAVALEVRVPFLDHPLVEFASRIPDALKIEGGRGKAILVKAVEDLLPPGHVDRPKEGFVFPLATWLRTDLRSVGDEILSESSLARRGILRPDAVASQWQRFLAGDPHVHFKRIWSLIVLELWLRRHVDAPPVPREAPAGAVR